MKTAIAFLSLFLLSGAAETRLGKPMTLKEPVSVDAVVSSPDRYVGQTVQVKGNVTEVCKKMGCWMMLVDPGSKKAIRIKVKDGDIVFPESAIGKPAVAEGKLVKLELTKEQVISARKHEAEENGKKFDPSTVKGGETMYQIAGTGAVLLE
jgi:hypothetical protein